LLELRKREFLKNIQSLRGMNDIYGEISEKFIHIISVAEKVAKRYGFKYIETPLLEETALFKRSVGESSDIVGKEMYQFTDKGGNDVSLRPEGTAGVVRSFIQNKFDKRGGKEKVFYHGGMFRYERPQKGRLRLFHQFGCESFGENSVFEDISIILMIKDIFDELGIGFKLKINSLGCQECMPKYREDLSRFLETKRDNLCSDCHRRIDTNPIRTLDCKIEKCQNELVEAPKIADNLCESCNTDFEILKRVLEKSNVEFEIDKNLVRGLDYYSKTAFEFVSSEIGSQNAIAGGGRYDRLVEFLGGKETPAVGFALGIERILDLVKLPEIEKDGYYFGVLDEEYFEKLYILGSEKRQNKKVHIEMKKRSLNKHLQNADKLGFRFCAILGSDEVENGTIWIRDLKNGNDETFSQDSF
jgi:histidyl-tRNA synthetase